MPQVLREQRAWRDAARQLGIEFEAPYVLEHEGMRHDFLGRLPQFGADRGMLLMLSYDGLAAEAALACGFGFSCVEIGSDVDPNSIIDLLEDWGWACRNESPPEYLAGRLRHSRIRP